ncbi:MAG: hypothetical protein JWO97_4421 [Acidobacteria bacterium]|nr:hypothetical protein [Acidobacteriota bacterium]
MSQDTRRITLICRGVAAPPRSWRTGTDSPTRNILLQAFPVLTYALHNGLNELQQDVERVIIDHATTADAFLDMLTSLPSDFMGDILFIQDEKKGYLSATGRGGDRVLYALAEADVDFYLQTHSLTRVWAIPVLRIA